MRALLDSHAFLWWLMDDKRLTREARAAISDADSVVFVSAASIWEISIKASLGRIDLGESDLVAEISLNGFLELPITALHARRAGALPDVHSDPFDRLLIAQSELEDLTCVTRDSAFESYAIRTFW